MKAAIKSGTVTVTATARDGSGVTSTFELSIVPVTINYFQEKTNEIIPTTVEYSIDNGINWITGLDTVLDLIPGQNVDFRTAAGSKHIQTLSVPARPAGITFSYANSVSDYLVGLPANATNLEVRIISNESITQDWTGIAVDPDGKVSLSHNGGDLIQVRSKAVSGAAFAGDIVQQYSKKLISELSIGDLVTDNSWQWEHKTGTGYTGVGVLKPITWTVVAKNHYGADSGVTLLSKDLIGQFIFDNRTGVHWGGVNLWGPSDHLRPWLNGSGDYAGNGFYDAFSDEFKNSVLMTDVPNEGYLEW